MDNIFITLFNLLKENKMIGLNGTRYPLIEFSFVDYASQATEMIVMGFLEPFTRELPMEYAVELNQLLKLDMEGSIG